MDTPEKDMYEKMVTDMIDNLDIKELMSLGREICEKFGIDNELYEFFKKEVVEIPVED